MSRHAKIRHGLPWQDMVGRGGSGYVRKHQDNNIIYEAVSLRALKAVDDTSRCHPMTDATADSTTGSDDRPPWLAAEPPANFDSPTDAESTTDAARTAEAERSTTRRSSPTRLERIRRRVVTIGFALVVSVPVVIGPAAAQGTVGSSLCGTPIANFINSAAPLVVALAMIVGTVFAYLMHSRAGLARDAEQAQFYLDWRNRAGYTAITAPLLAFLLQMMIGFTGTGVDACIDLVPFF